MVDDNRQHLNDIQDLCTGTATDESELVLGSIYGLREWFFTNDLERLRSTTTATLTGHFNQEWNPLITHEAECLAEDTVTFDFTEILDAPDLDADEIEFRIRTRARVFFEQAFTKNLSLDPLTAHCRVSFSSEAGLLPWREVDWLLDDPDSDAHYIQVPMNFVRALRRFGIGKICLSLTGRRREHPVGHPSCVCGIYAYHDRGSLQPTSRFLAGPSVFGLVRADGHVTVGTKGFRAERANVVALTVPRVPGGLPKYLRGDWDRIEKSWTDAGITVLPDLSTLLEFADRGGYLERPGDLQTESSSEK
jgi:hypothetical protein